MKNIRARELRGICIEVEVVDHQLPCAWSIWIAIVCGAIVRDACERGIGVAGCCNLLTIVVGLVGAIVLHIKEHTIRACRERNLLSDGVVALVP